MTRKHFEAIAKALNSTKPHNPYSHINEAEQTWIDTVKAVAIACQNANSNFDMARFKDACFGGKE